MTPRETLAKQLEKKFADQGMLIEAGWVGFTLFVAPDASKIQLDEMHTAFFAGAQHLFSSIMSILGTGSEPTAKDLNRMSLINSELEAFAQLLYKRERSPGGH